MRRQPKARTTKSKSRQDDFYVIKEKAESRRKENVVELEINMERMGSKIIEMVKLNKKDIDLQENRLIVENGKNNKRRIVPIEV